MTVMAALAQSTAQAAAAPWWGVPVLTGSATLFGALIAFFSARASDSRKAKRDKTERIMLETRDNGLEYLSAVGKIESLVKLQQTTSRAKMFDEYITELFDAIVDVEDKWQRFELYAHDQALESGQKLLVSCLTLMIPAENMQATSEDLGDLSRKRLDFMNVLREASGVKKIERDIPDPINRQKFVEENTELLATVYERLRTDSLNRSND